MVLPCSKAVHPRSRLFICGRDPSSSVVAVPGSGQFEIRGQPMLPITPFSRNLPLRVFSTHELRDCRARIVQPISQARSCLSCRVRIYGRRRTRAIHCLRLDPHTCSDHCTGEWRFGDNFANLRILGGCLDRCRPRQRSRVTVEGRGSRVAWMGGERGATCSMVRYRNKTHLQLCSWACDATTPARV